MSSSNDAFHVRAELYSPARYPPKVYELYRTRKVATDIIAQQCWLVVLAVAHIHTTMARPKLPRIGILGGGHMGCAVTMALLENGYPSELIAISTRQPEKTPKASASTTAPHPSQFESVTRFYDNVRLTKESDVLILCMPPSQLKSVAIQIKHALSVAHSPCVVVSLLCGAPIETLQKACSTQLVVRTRVHVHELKERFIRATDTAQTDALGAVREPAATQADDEDTLALALQHLRLNLPVGSNTDTHASHGAHTTGSTIPTSPLTSVLRDLKRRLAMRYASQETADAARKHSTLPIDKTAMDTASIETSMEDPFDQLQWPSPWTLWLEHLHRHLGPFV